MSDATHASSTRSADASNSGASIVFDHVTKAYSGQGSPAVEDLSFEIPAGELVAFVGPSGCGKTTSLKMINRLVEPTSGTIYIDGEDATKKTPRSCVAILAMSSKAAGSSPTCLLRIISPWCPS